MSGEEPHSVNSLEMMKLCRRHDERVRESHVRPGNSNREGSLENDYLSKARCDPNRGYANRK